MLRMMNLCTLNFNVFACVGGFSLVSSNIEVTPLSSGLGAPLNSCAAILVKCPNIINDTASNRQRTRRWRVHGKLSCSWQLSMVCSNICQALGPTCCWGKTHGYSLVGRELFGACEIHWWVAKVAVPLGAELQRIKIMMSVTL